LSEVWLLKFLRLMYCCQHLPAQSIQDIAASAITCRGQDRSGDIFWTWMVRNNMHYSNQYNGVSTMIHNQTLCTSSSFWWS
jgi:hypothetical protein